MGQIKWYKRDPEAALRGMHTLSLELRGAYNTILDLIYSRDGQLPDDDRFIAGFLGVDVRVWKRLKTALIDAGKLYVEAGMLRNETADVVVATALARVVSAQNAGKVSAQSRAGKSPRKPRENSDLAPKGVEADAPTGVGTGVRENKNKKETPLPPEGGMAVESEIPDWVPAAEWAGFEDMRKRIKKPLTPRARTLAIAKLSELRAAGHDPAQVLDRSTLNSWQGLFELPSQAGSGGGGNGRGPSSEPLNFLDFKIAEKRQREEWERQKRAEA